MLNKAFHAPLQKVLSDRVQLNSDDVFSLLMRGPFTTKTGHCRPASETPFQWRFAKRADDGPTLNAGLVAM